MRPQCAFPATMTRVESVAKSNLRSCQVTIIKRRDELVRRLGSARDEAISALRAMDPAEFEAGRYENGWNARQILAHVAAIEWTYPRLLDLPARGEKSTDSAATRNAAPEVRDRMDDYNARQVDRRAGATVAELIEGFSRNREATIAAFASADEATLSRQVESFGGMQGELIDVIEAVVLGHVEGHIRDITG